MSKTLILSWYRLAHNQPVRIILDQIIRDPEVKKQLDIIDLIKPKDQIKVWHNQIRYNNYDRIILFPKELTCHYFDFPHLFDFCNEHNIEIINGDCVESLDKFATNQLWKDADLPAPNMYLLQHELDRFDVPDEDFPAIISASIGHGGFGQHTLIFDSDSIEMWLRPNWFSVNKIVTQFINCRDRDGYFRKGRVIRLNDDYVDVNVMGHRTNWHVHHTTPDIELLCPNCSYYRNMISDFDDQVAELFNVANIQVGALDFCEVDGKVIPFEITVPFHRSYRYYEWEKPTYNKHKHETIQNVCNYFITYLRNLCLIEYDWDQFELDFVDYIHKHKGLTRV